MHYIKKIYVLLLTGSIVSITGCSAIQYSTEDLPRKSLFAATVLHSISCSVQHKAVLQTAQ